MPRDFFSLFFFLLEVFLVNELVSRFPFTPVAYLFFFPHKRAFFWGYFEMRAHLRALLLLLVVVVILSFQLASPFVRARAELIEVEPPKSTQTNCKPACPRLSVPDACSVVGSEEDVASWKQRHEHRRRRLLAATSSRRRSSGGRKSSGGSSKPLKSRGQSQPFAPPSNEFVEVLRTNLRHWRDAEELRDKRGGLWTYDCVKNYWPEDKIHMNITREITHPRHPFLRLFVGNKVPPEEKWKEYFADIKPFGLGTCAVVAVGSNLLKSNRGKEIDAHDTVIRYNSPMKKYEKSVGKKSDVIYWKIRGDEKEYGQEGQKAARYYMFKDETKLRMVASKKELGDNTFKGKPILWPSPRRNTVFEAAYFLYKKENKKISRGSASGGYKLAGDILASGLCSRVDLYGYSSEGAGKYFNLGKTMSSVHLMGLENFVYRVAQEEEMVCVYD